jgi:hypothetical protein
LAGAAVVGAVGMAKQADTSRRLGNQANDQAKANALKTQQASEEANNKANAKSPDVTAMLSANLLAGKSGQSGTMLTGPSGVDAGTLTLGKASLLGS